MLKSKNNIKGFYSAAKHLGDYLPEKDFSSNNVLKKTRPD